MKVTCIYRLIAKYETWTLLALALAVVVAQVPAALAEEMVLQDHLGRDWRNELVRFDVSEAQLKMAREGKALQGADNIAVPYQLVQDAGKTRLVFQANLKPWEKRTYDFAPVAAPTVPNITVEESAEELRLSNGVAGIALAKTLHNEQGPVRAMRLASGQWIGSSKLRAASPLKSYSASVVSRGPVFSEVQCVATFENGGSWRLSARVEANEPMVLIDEEYSLRDASAWTINFSPGFAPDSLFHRMGVLPGKAATWKITADKLPVFLWEPWLHWWEKSRQGTWFGFYKEAGSNMLALASRQADDWVEPSGSNAEEARIPVTLEGGELQATLPLRKGQRKWMLMALDKAACLSVLNEAEPAPAPLPQQLQIKHGDFPLDIVKNYIVQWPGDEEGYPRLLVTKAQVDKFRAGFKADPRLLERYTKEPLAPNLMDGPIQYYLGTGDAALGRHLATTALQMLQESVDMLVQQRCQITLGFAPHHQTRILVALNLADAVRSTAFTPEERERFKAQVAFLGYTVSRDDYWSPARGFAANPNMTTSVAAFQAAIASAIPSHPRSKEWMQRAMHELKEKQLDKWADDNGGWLEAPHYAMVSFDYLTGIFLMAHNAGLNDFLFDPKMKQVADWFAKTSTPPDSRIQGRRHMPAIGNTYLNEPTGAFGIMAGIWKDKDPDFAARMQWMHRQQGSPPEPGLGGFFPTMAGYRQMILDETIPEKAPSYGSELFPETGVLLRSGFATERENQLLLIAGRNHEHYDKDSGSITLWGKGRIVADDFGYEGHMPGTDHSMLVSPNAPDSEKMQVEEFAPGKNLDYVRGRKMAWQRQIAFVKDDEPAAPNYFVLRDSMTVPTAATWRLWLAAEKVVPHAQGALAVGLEDVNTDVFFALPTTPVLTTEEKASTSYGLAPHGKFERFGAKQIALVANVDKERAALVVVYPRLKTEKPPVITSIAEGKGVKVESAAGTDYVFLNEKTFTFKEGDIAFSGTSGVVKIRNGQALLSLGAAGSITARGKSLIRETSELRPVSRLNLVANGDFSGNELPFAAPAPGALTIGIHEGDPAHAAADTTGQRSMTMTLREAVKERPASFSLKNKLFIDSSKVYRLKLRALVPEAMRLGIGGYASGGANPLLKVGERVWEWGVAAKGPNNQWQTVEATIGPEGSGANFIWPAEAVATGMTFWVSGEKGTAYVDDLEFSESAPE